MWRREHYTELLNCHRGKRVYKRVFTNPVTHTGYGIPTGCRMQRKKTLPCKSLCTLINGLRACMRAVKVRSDRCARGRSLAGRLAPRCCQRRRGYWTQMAEYFALTAISLWRRGPIGCTSAPISIRPRRSGRRSRI